MTIAPGTLVEHYRVGELIGAGAMGEVYQAVDEGLGRQVALKILLETHRGNRELRARFVREARAVARISHPNVVQVFTTGEHDGRPFFAMELLHGQDLGSLVRTSGALGSYAASSVILDAARGLQAAANANLIHRDVKPSNLVRLDSGPVKVTDFGLAKPLIDDEDPGLTALGVVVGTPDYIAPEQARGEEIDALVDIYSLGCTLYFCLVGKAPFRRGNDDEDKYMKVVARHLREAAPDPRRLALAVDDELADLALSMMSKTAADRPGYDEVIARLEEVHARLHPPRAGTAPLRRAPARPSADPASVPDLEPASPSQSRAWLWILTGLSTAVLITGIALTLSGSSAAVTAIAPDGSLAALPNPIVPDAGPAKPPAGMLETSGAHGRFFVDRVAVTNRAYAERVPAHRYPAGDADRPVLSISYADAKAYAQARGKRLLRDDEWLSALDTLGFVPAGMEIWEWVDDGGGDAHRHDQAVRRVNDGVGRRRASGDKLTTFRLAQDSK